jgi:hypothetical protein
MFVAISSVSGGKSGGKYGDFGGFEGTQGSFRFSNLLIRQVTRPSSNPSLSANSSPSVHDRRIALSGNQLGVSRKIRPIPR